MTTNRRSRESGHLSSAPSPLEGGGWGEGEIQTETLTGLTQQGVSAIKDAGTTAEQLLTHFDRIADAPDAIPRLRRFVLDLAVRGKLVEQDPEDEPAYICCADGKRRDLDQYVDATLPTGWLVAPVGVLLNFQYGKGMKASERLAEGPVPVFGSNGIVGYCETPLTEKPSIIVGRKGSAGALNLCDGPSWTTDVAYFVETPAFFDLRYFLVGLQTLNLETLGKGVKPGLSRSDAYELLLRLPPLAEQRRIVAKVDELMALCDRLETARKEREATRDRLTAASLARLNAPDLDPAVFQNHAAFALDNLTPLTTRPDQIKALRQTILNLAVRGKLVEQDPEDEPAGELLKRVAAEKARLVETGKIRDTKAAVEALNENFTHQLPLNWSVVTISQIAYLRSGTALKHGEEQDIGNVPYLKVADLSLVENDKGIITSSRFVGWDRKGDVIESGSIVFPKRGGAIATNRKRRTHVNIVCDSNIMAMKPFAHDTLPFLELWFNSFDLWKLNSGTSVPQINNKDIYPLPLLLPPLAEQHRIVAKVDELMAVCDRLEAGLAAGEETRGRLVKAVLHNTLNPDGSHRELAH